MFMVFVVCIYLSIVFAFCIFNLIKFNNSLTHSLVCIRLMFLLQKKYLIEMISCELWTCNKLIKIYKEKCCFVLNCLRNFMQSKCVSNNEMNLIFFWAEKLINSVFKEWNNQKQYFIMQDGITKIDEHRQYEVVKEWFFFINKMFKREHYVYCIQYTLWRHLQWFWISNDKHWEERKKRINKPVDALSFSACQNQFVMHVLVDFEYIHNRDTNASIVSSLKTVHLFLSLSFIRFTGFLLFSLLFSVYIIILKRRKERT